MLRRVLGLFSENLRDPAALTQSRSPAASGQFHNSGEKEGAIEQAARSRFRFAP
jgi:hypothetical protein